MNDKFNHNNILTFLFLFVSLPLLEFVNLAYNGTYFSLSSFLYLLMVDLVAKSTPLAFSKLMLSFKGIRLIREIVRNYLYGSIMLIFSMYVWIIYFSESNLAVLILVTPYVILITVPALIMSCILTRCIRKNQRAEGQP
ncbi:hypothetical protein DS891_15295 [Pseudoalteromonas sp. JC28]|nr:hypothetical protein [Pseudoalteromonas sp. JC28]